jgi:hypothetical protein
MSTTVNGTANGSTRRIHSLTVVESEALIRNCRWHELALRRHGFDPERLMRLARKVAHDELALKGAVLGDRFEDLASRLYEIGLKAALAYDPSRRHESYGRNGGEPFASYVADIFAMRVTDHFRSKADGFGDRRYGHDNRIELQEDPDPADHDTDFESLVDERRRARWQQAASAAGWTLSEFIVTTLDIASEQQLAV